MRRIGIDLVERRMAARRILLATVNMAGTHQHDAAFLEEDDRMVVRCLFIVDLNKDSAEPGNAKYIGGTIDFPYSDAALQEAANEMKEQINLFREGKY